MPNITLEEDLERYYLQVAKAGRAGRNFAKYFVLNKNKYKDFSDNVRQAKLLCLEETYSPGVYASAEEMGQLASKCAANKTAAFAIFPGTGEILTRCFAVPVPCSMLTVKKLLPQAIKIFLNNNKNLFELSAEEKKQKCHGDFAALGYFIAAWHDYKSKKWKISAAEIYLNEMDALFRPIKVRRIAILDLRKERVKEGTDIYYYDKHIPPEDKETRRKRYQSVMEFKKFIETLNNSTEKHKVISAKDGFSLLKEHLTNSCVCFFHIPMPDKYGHTLVGSLVALRLAYIDIHSDKIKEYRKYCEKETVPIKGIIAIDNGFCGISENQLIEKSNFFVNTMRKLCHYYNLTNILIRFYAGGGIFITCIMDYQGRIIKDLSEEIPSEEMLSEYIDFSKDWLNFDDEDGKPIIENWISGMVYSNEILELKNY